MQPIMVNRFEYTYDYMKKVYKQRDRLLCDMFIGLGIVFAAYMMITYIKNGENIMIFNAVCIFAITFGIGFGYPYMNLSIWKSGMKKNRDDSSLKEVIRYEFYDEYFNICNENTGAVAEIEYTDVKKVKSFPVFIGVTARWNGKKVSFDIPWEGFDDAEEGEKLIQEKMGKHK